MKRDSDDQVNRMKKKMQNTCKAKDMELIRLQTNLEANRTSYELQIDNLNRKVRQLIAKKQADRTLIADLTTKINALEQ